MNKNTNMKMDNGPRLWCIPQHLKGGAVPNGLASSGSLFHKVW